MHLHRSQWLDVVGALLSALCIVHCVALPVLAVVMPFVTSGAFDLWLGVLLASVASVAIVVGTRSHGRLMPFVPFALGMLLFLASHLAVDPHSGLGLALAVLGSAALVGAHWLNFRARRDLGCCPVPAAV